MAIVYKIRRNGDGLFSSGGRWPSFSKTGKIWKQKGHLTSHLGQLDRHRKTVYDNCEIVPYELVETPAGPSITIDEYLRIVDERSAARGLVRKNKQEEWARERRLKEFERLKKEFGE